VFCPANKSHPIEMKLKNYFTTLGFSLKNTNSLSFPVFLSCLPGMISPEWITDFKTYGLTHTMVSQQATQLLPLQGEWSGSKSPQMLIVGRQGQMSFFDPFDKMGEGGNFNVAICGKSGAGKSNFMAEMALCRVATGGRVWIIDVGYSYKHLADAIGGKFIEFKTGGMTSLNPFSTMSVLDDESMLLLRPLIAKMAFRKRDTTEIEDNFIEQAIKATFEKYGSRTTVTEITKYLARQKDDVAHKLAQALYTFTAEGTYGKYFEGESDLDFDEDFIVFELEELKNKPELQEVVMLMLVFKIQQKMYSQRDRRQCLLIDEGWQLLNGGTSAKFIENAARRCRKFNGSLVVGTQQLTDFFESKCGEAIYHNSDWLLVMAQKPEAVERALSVAPNLSSVAPLIKSLKTKSGHYSEILIKSSFGHIVGRLHLDPYTARLFSTTPGQFTEPEKKE
jgi:conjugal transfer ATP-binding protein TraC